jgi:TonB family protein
MKFPNILISVFLHAGLIVGMVCGSQHQDEVEAGPAEPVFFEILEECAVAASEPVEAVKSLNEAKPETKPFSEKPTNPINENSIRNEFSGLGESENNENKVVDTFNLEPLTAENSVRTEFSGEVDEAHVREEVGKMEASDRVETDEVEGIKKDEIEEVEVDEDEMESVVHRDERSEERDEAKPAELEQAKVVSAPMALNRIIPVYPRSARRRGREGVVTVEITVSDFGEVSGVEVIAGSGYNDLDSAAVSAVRTARFAPATENGVRVHGSLRLTFEFKLR